MSKTYTEIEIAAPPERVRETFLDWSAMREWHPDGFFKSIAPTVPKTNVEQGDRLNVAVTGTTFSSTVLENSPQQFKWRGGIPLLLHGDHYFTFAASQETPGGTTFKHGEDFGGLLGYVLGSWLGGEKQAKAFEGFNRDLKAKVESTE